MRAGEAESAEAGGPKSRDIECQIGKRLCALGRGAREVPAARVPRAETPRLYQIAANPTAYAAAFHDITTGDNSWGGVTGYDAASGWDPETGLGTPDVANLITALKSTAP